MTKYRKYTKWDDTNKIHETMLNRFINLSPRNHFLIDHQQPTVFVSSFRSTVDPCCGIEIYRARGFTRLSEAVSRYDHAEWKVDCSQTSAGWARWKFKTVLGGFSPSRGLSIGCMRVGHRPTGGGSSARQINRYMAYRKSCIRGWTSERTNERANARACTYRGIFRWENL